LVRDEVPDCRLGTLASRLRLDHRPTHRALDDALATTDLLHLLIERAAGLGVLGLDDLLALPRIGSHPQAAKLKLTLQLPRSPGVYRFHGAHDEVLYVGKATNLRQRVRSYFGSDDRRKIGPMLRETRRVSYTVTHDPVTAEVLELRELHAAEPRYNRVGTTWKRYCYVRLTTDEAWPRLAIVSEPAASGLHLGPLPSRAAATNVIEAIQSVVPLRRCSTRLGRSYTPAPGATSCSAAQLGVAMCPCAGEADPVRYAVAVSTVVAALTEAPHLVLEPLHRRIEALAVERRYEEAALARDRAAAFATAVKRQRMADQLRAAGDTGVQIGSTVLHLTGGVLAGVRRDGQLLGTLDLPAPAVPVPPAPLPRHAADEVWCLARAIQRNASRARLLWCDGEWAWPSTPVGELTRLRVA
jgi:DNA polymerase-3 subunit epsilon